MSRVLLKVSWLALRRLSPSLIEEHTPPVISAVLSQLTSNPSAGGLKGAKSHRPRRAPTVTSCFKNVIESL
uniref:Secreted protein n=1 Tax=Panagrellus redivivus TaxID=6233 RepID=A0A7E4VTU0_PANRE